MAATRLSDKEVLNKIVSYLYNGGDYQIITVSLIVEEYSGRLKLRDALRLCEKLKQEDVLKFAQMAKKNTITEHDFLIIESRGIEIMNEYGTYEAYLTSLEKEEKKEKRATKIDRNIKNGNLIATVIISAVGIYVGINQSSTKSTQQNILQGIESTSRQLDTLRQDLYKLRDSIKQLPVQNTDTSK